MNQLLRTFIAIDLPAAVTAELQRRTELLARATPRGSVRWGRADQIHLTLKFLGDVESRRIEAITTALGEALRDSHAFELTLAGNGAFPSLDRPRVLWAGVEMHDETLSALQSAVEESMAGIGYARETRPFSPHLTLGRVREGSGAVYLRAVREAIAAPLDRPVLGFLASRVVLFRSQLRPEGALYSSLAQFELEARA